VGVSACVTKPENKQSNRINDNDALRSFIETMEELNKKSL
jgi:hypothetical protein